MPSHYSHLGIRFRQQCGLCFYCSFRAWMPEEGILRAAKRLDLPTEGHGWKKAIQRRMATKEHLHRHADGGHDALENYVMAHRWCNKIRGERSVEEHKSRIIEMVKAGKCKTSPSWVAPGFSASQNIAERLPSSDAAEVRGHSVTVSELSR